MVLVRAFWFGAWLVRNRKSRKVRIGLRALALPLTMVAGALWGALWPGVPAAAAGALGYWITSGGRFGADWWQQPLPVTVAGVVFGVVCGGIVGREVERIGVGLPGMRREGLRALAVLGGFVAICAAAVQAIAYFI